jgi:DNA mismatch repair protein MutH
MRTPPHDKTELTQRAQALAGMTLGELAHIAHRAVPVDLKRDKGWVGQLIEWHLGANAGSAPTPDFVHLGIELKTLPIGVHLQPLESTFVCVAPLLKVQGLQWQNSYLRHKLATVLWVPVEGERSIPIAERQVGTPFFWQPNKVEEMKMQQDWEELMDMIVLGQVENITARHGDVLQLRPKGANGQALTQAYGANGNIILTRPRGFYLKRSFTAEILKNVFFL